MSVELIPATSLQKNISVCYIQLYWKQSSQIFHVYYYTSRNKVNQLKYWEDWLDIETELISEAILMVVWQIDLFLFNGHPCNLTSVYTVANKVFVLISLNLMHSSKMTEKWFIQDENLKVGSQQYRAGSASSIECAGWSSSILVANANHFCFQQDKDSSSNLMSLCLKVTYIT